MTRGETNANGDTQFELSGTFDRTQGVEEDTWGWLLQGTEDCFTATPKLLDLKTNNASFEFLEKQIPDLTGKKLAYLNANWQAFHVWMVLRPDWGWERIRFDASDAIGEGFKASDVSIVDGREVRNWMKVEKASGSSHTTRYYPEGHQKLPSSVEGGIIPGGWDHEHCTLCREHINSGEFGYRDPDDRWACESCHEKYIRTHDLAFIDDL